MHGGGCDRRTKRSREELPHLRGQGQKPGGPYAQREAAKRTYPTPEARGRGKEENPTSKERWLHRHRRA